MHSCCYGTHINLFLQFIMKKDLFFLFYYLACDGFFAFMMFNRTIQVIGLILVWQLSKRNLRAIGLRYFKL
jgi:hypothetical protein